MGTNLRERGRRGPISIDLPTDPKARRKARVLRGICYFLVFAALVTPLVQFTLLTRRNVRKGQKYDQKVVAGEISPDAEEPKRHKGAIGRWSRHVDAFWRGENIYHRPVDPDANEPRPEPDEDDLERAQGVHLHPNMPLVVILLTPFSWLPPTAAALVFTILKVLVIALAFWMIADVARHHDAKLPDWVLGLGIAWSLPFIIGDIQHGNTNGFVLAAVVCHLWLYRKGRDWLAGVPLALAICIKMTPALFVLYWLYQRNWKLLGGTVIAGLVLAVGFPTAILGPERFLAFGESWMENLILPGLVEGAWYPIHVNQSISGVFSRLFLDGQFGDIFWNADDDPHYTGLRKPGWITLISLSPATVKMMVRVVQVAVVGLMAWAIGWRKLPRTDGRRTMHYGLVTLGILLLNQRTWSHHSGILLVAATGVWTALAFGRMGKRVRQVALAMVIAAGVLEWANGGAFFKLIAKIGGHSSKVGEHWADYASAYGITFWHYVLMFAASVLLLVSLKGKEDPYAPTRQKVFSDTRE